MGIGEAITMMFRPEQRVNELFTKLEGKMYKEFMKAKFAEANDSVKYIADIDTHELIWMNTTLQKLVCLPEDEWRNTPCHIVLQDLPAPCKFCTNDKLKKEGEIYQWVHYNEKLNKIFLVRDFLVVIDGRRLRFENAIDITEQINEIKSYGR